MKKTLAAIVIGVMAAVTAFGANAFAEENSENLVVDNVEYKEDDGFINSTSVTWHDAAGNEYRQTIKIIEIKPEPKPEPADDEAGSRDEADPDSGAHDEADTRGGASGSWDEADPHDEADTRGGASGSWDDTDPHDEANTRGGASGSW